ncbi:MAG TPA: protein translocase subunit SecF [Candidatus Deferrimicrobiaceae bacterium]|jgi:preprotein translocase subunit SecF
MIELIKGTNIDFMGLRKFAFVFSGALILLCVFALVQIYRGNGNLGIDLAGGTSLQLKFKAPVDLDKARGLLGAAGLGHAGLQWVEGENILLVKVGAKGKEEKMVADAVVNSLRTGMPDNPPAVESVSEIGPAVGQKLRGDAALAMLVSAIAIIGYLAYRFEFKFGVGAAIATFHDIAAMIGIFFLLGREMDLLFITALLTIGGYSLTDTVVVFDRIRENLHLRKKGNFYDTVNHSVNEVLSRTIVTSLTVFLCCLSLLMFGGVVLKDFALALTIGVVIGTYSSVFVASPVVAYLKGERKVEAKG